VSATTFTEVIFTGSITNNTAAPITFELSGFANPFEPYIASYQNGIGFPGITLGPGASTGTIDLAIVTLQLFDPHLSYPAFVTIVLPATDSTGRLFAENDASIEIVTAIPEPSVLLLLIISLSVLGVILRSSRHS
jgi:hypothetical protein